MKLKNWLFLSILALTLGLTTAKRINSSIDPHKGYSLHSVEFCSSICQKVETCSMEDRNPLVQDKSEEIGMACNVLCKKGHPNFNNCSERNIGCNDLMKCISGVKPKTQKISLGSNE
jgi:Cys-rich protein (TIGR04453 family)